MYPDSPNLGEEEESSDREKYIVDTFKISSSYNVEQKHLCWKNSPDIFHENII